MRVTACLAVVLCIGGRSAATAGQDATEIFKPGPGVSLPVVVKEPYTVYPPDVMRRFLFEQKEVEVDGWYSREDALAEIEASRARFRERQAQY